MTLTNRIQKRFRVISVLTCMTGFLLIPTAARAENACSVKYSTSSNRNGNLILEFEVKRSGMDNNDLGILWTYRINYCCKNGRSHTSRSQTVLKLPQHGEFYKSPDEEFIAQECPVEIRRVESVEITSVDCK